MDQVKFLKDSFYKIWSDMAFPQILLGPFLNPWSISLLSMFKFKHFILKWDMSKIVLRNLLSANPTKLSNKGAALIRGEAFISMWIPKGAALIWDLALIRGFNTVFFSFLQNDNEKQGDFIWQEVWRTSIHLFEVRWSNHLVSYFSLTLHCGISTNLLLLTFFRAEFSLFLVKY